MKRVSKIIATAIVSSALLGGSSAWGAPLSTAMKGANDQLLLQVSTIAGQGGFGSLNGASHSAYFRTPAGLAISSDGVVHIADSRNHLIRKINKNGDVANHSGVLYKLDAKGLPIGGLVDGAADAALLQEPHGIAFDTAGNLYVADAGNHSIRKVSPTGAVTTLAGNGVLGSKDGKGSAAAFYRPSDVAIAADGTLYVADTLNHTIRSISPAGEVKTLNAASTRVVQASPGQAVPAGDFKDGALQSAKFNEPTSLALDAKGNLYVSDSGNHRIRYIDLKQGTVSTVAGSSVSADKSSIYAPNALYAEGDLADGKALEALFNYPQGLAVTEEGGLIIADSGNHAIRYLLNGKVTTLAGSSAQVTGELDGTENFSRFHRPTDVAITKDGQIVVADSYNNKIRVVEPYSLPANLPKDNKVKVVLDSKWIEFDADPEITNGRTMVPVRAITEALGYKVTFEDATQTVKLTKDKVTIELYVGRTGVKKLNGDLPAVTKQTDVEPYIKQDRTYVPVRFFAEEIGLDVQWDNETRTAIIRGAATTKP